MNSVSCFLSYISFSLYSFLFFSFWCLTAEWVGSSRSLPPGLCGVTRMDGHHLAREWKGAEWLRWCSGHPHHLRDPGHHCPQQSHWGRENNVWSQCLQGPWPARQPLWHEPGIEGDSGVEPWRRCVEQPLSQFFWVLTCLSQTFNDEIQLFLHCVLRHRWLSQVIVSLLLTHSVPHSPISNFLISFPFGNSFCD